MQLKIIISFLCTLSMAIHPADEYSWRLQPGMWGTVGYGVSRSYSIKSIKPLTAQDVITPFFASLANESQEAKNSILEIAARIPGRDDEYPIRRKNMAAAIMIGANIFALQQKAANKSWRADLLAQAVRFRDIYLEQLMLACENVDVHERGFSISIPETAIYSAKTVPLAALLIEHGALNDPERIKQLLSEVAFPGYDPGLVTLYRMNGLSPLVCDEDNRTFLMRLTFSPEQKNMVKKAALLLDQLPLETVQILLAVQDARGATIFDYIDKQSKSPVYEEYIQNLNALKQFLLQKKRGDEVKCPICSVPCDYIQAPCTITLRNNTFHTACLQECELESLECDASS